MGGWFTSAVAVMIFVDAIVSPVVEVATMMIGGSVLYVVAAVCGVGCFVARGAVNTWTEEDCTASGDYASWWGDIAMADGMMGMTH